MTRGEVSRLLVSGVQLINSVTKVRYKYAGSHGIFAVKWSSTSEWGRIAITDIHGVENLIVDER